MPPVTTSRSTPRGPHRDPSVIEPALERVAHQWELIRPWALPPVAIGWLVAVGSGLWWAHLPPLTTLAWTCAGFMALSGFEHTFYLPGTRERTWSRCALLAALLLGWWYTASGPYAEWTVPVIGWHWQIGWVTAFLGAPFGLMWSQHRRVQLRNQVYRKILAWDADAVGMKGISAPPGTATTDGEVTETDLTADRPGEWTTETLRQKVPRLAAAWGVARAKIQLVEKTRVRGQPTRWRLTIDESDRAPEPTIYELPLQPTDGRDPYEVGKQSGADKALMAELYRRGHGAVDGLAGGDRGSGKTKRRQRDAAQAITSYNLMLWLADLKPGSPNWRDWAGLADWYTTDAGEFADMLMVAWAASFSPKRTETETHDPGGLNPDGSYDGDPGVVIILDECAIAFNPDEMAMTITGESKFKVQNAADRIVNMTKQFAQVSRSTAHSLLFSTVRLSFDSFGNDASIRAFVSSGERAGFRTGRAADARFLFAVAEPPSLDELPSDAPGTGWFQSIIYPDPIMGRAHMFVTTMNDPNVPEGMTSTHVDQLYSFVAQWPTASPSYHPTTLATIREKLGTDNPYEKRTRYRRDGTPIGGKEPTIVDAEVVDEPQAQIARDGFPMPTPQDTVSAPATTGKPVVCPQCGSRDVVMVRGGAGPNGIPSSDALFECRNDDCRSITTWSELTGNDANRSVFDIPADPNRPQAVQSPHLQAERFPPEDSPEFDEWPPPETYRAPPKANSAQESRQTVYDGMGDGWVKSTDVAAWLNKSSEMVRMRLSELYLQRRVERRGSNRARQYRKIPGNDDPVT